MKNIEIKPLRISALIMAVLGTILAGGVVAAHAFGVDIPSEVLTSAVVGYLMLLGQSINKLSEDAPEDPAGPSEDFQLKMRKMELDANASAPAEPTVTLTEKALKELARK